MCVVNNLTAKKQTPDIQTLSALFYRSESFGNSLKALYVKACKPFRNTNTSMPRTQHVFAGFSMSSLNW